MKRKKALSLWDAQGNGDLNGHSCKPSDRISQQENNWEGSHVRT